MTRFARWSAAVTLVCASLGLASSAGLLRAQGASTPQRQLLFLNEIELKPETAPEWMELQKSVLEAQKKAVPRRDVWTSGPGGNPFLRAVVTPISSLAQFDNPNPFIQAVGGQQAFAEFIAKNRRLVAASHSTILTTRPDLGFGTRPATLKLGVLSIVTAAGGRGPELEAFLKNDIVPALKKGGATYYSVAQVVFGDDVNKYMTLTLYNDFAEIAKGSPLERALGSEGMMKLTQKAGPLITKLERRIIRYVPDLSFGPPTTSN